MSDGAGLWWRYLALVGLAWVAIMGARLYPHFGDTLRLDDRVMSFEEYVEESCGQRIGPAAATCLEEARDRGHRLVAHQQAKSLLLVEAPLLVLLAIYVPLRATRQRLKTRG